MRSLPRKTKIICTLGPATDSHDMLKSMILAGTNIFRLNMSHATHDWVRKTVTIIRSLGDELHRNVGILMDTQGPAIRTGDLPTKLQLNVGDTFTFTVRGNLSEETNSVDVNYDDLVRDIKVGDTVLVDNGVIRMKVLSKVDDIKLVCQVLTPGLLGNRRHINLPGVKVNLPALTEKDLADVEVGLEVGVDYIALSFVREAADVHQLRKILEKHRSEIKIVAKIEDQSAVRNISEIIEAADAIMVARGDLGIEVPYEELPIIQRKILKTCVKRVRPVIVATHMLESMIGNPIPTRAEITDVANAVFEQADAIMLSGETTVGKYPLECVAVLDRVAQRIERSGNAGYSDAIELKTDHERVAASAVMLANGAKAEGICVFTRRGNLAAMVAGLRPRTALVFAFAPTAALCRRLALNFGIYAIQVDFANDPEMNILAAEDRLKRRNLVTPGDKLVVLSDVVIADQVLHTVHMREVG